jgi:5'-nucleotidase
MVILVTNDDGIESPGLQILAQDLSREHEVWTVAPKHERSGTSHGITMKAPVCMHRLDERAFSIDGTPADCVIYSLLGAIPARPDVIISGINLGPNVGTDILYSGTAAAAREAALHKVPGIALSINAKQAPFHFHVLTGFLSENLQLLLEMWHPDHFININAPNIDTAGLDVAITHPSRRVYKDRIEGFRAPNGDTYMFFAGEIPQAEAEQGSDWEAISDGKMSISPVFLHPINHEHESLYDPAKFRRSM